LIVVFGGGGQLGRELTAMAADRHVALRAVGHTEVDIADRDAVTAMVGSVRPAVVVNAAAFTAVDAAESDPDRAMRVNAEAPGIVAETCNAIGAAMIHISTDFVFDGAKNSPYREDDAVAPLGVYGMSKARGEAAVRDALDRQIIIRTAWLFGIYGSNFLKAVLRLAAERDDMEMVADQRGSPTPAADLAAAVLAATAAIDAGTATFGTYHFAGAGAATRHAFASRVVAAQAAFTGRRPAVNAITAKAFGAAARRPAYSVLDSSKFAAAFGVRAGPWEDAVDRTVAALMSGTAPS
jgi:dTDP-4-dehydrorhamnose reductase